jgi:hypothetical protein
MFGGRPASDRDVVWKNRKKNFGKIEEILASPPLKRIPVTEKTRFPTKKKNVDG